MLLEFYWLTDAAQAKVLCIIVSVVSQRRPPFTCRVERTELVFL